MSQQLDADRGPGNLRGVIDRAVREIGEYIQATRNGHLVKRWSEWNDHLTGFRTQLGEVPRVSISLLGDSGAGKSTLVNALVGASLLPVSDRQACTSAITEVSYSEDHFTADVEFISRESWQKEVDFLLADVRTVPPIAGEVDPVANDDVEVSRSARAKLWCVYRPDEDADKETFDLSRLEMPREISDALDAGRRRIRDSDLKTFVKAIAPYLRSDHRFWPIVKRVVIRGPFEALADGVTLVDLPGMNDPNEAREEVTREHLKTCRFVWVVFNMKRALTKAALEIMESDDFLRQIIMDGRGDALTFVGTHSDEVDLPDDEDDPRLPIDIVRDRNRAVRNIIEEQLRGLAGRLERRSPELIQVVKRFGQQLIASRVFTVSAKEYLRLKGIKRQHAPIIERTDDTEVPALSDHLREISRGFGVSEHCRRIVTQVRLLFSEIASETQNQQAILQTQIQISERDREELRADIQSARSFLDRDLRREEDQLGADLEGNQRLLAERVARAVDRARTGLHGVFAGWRQMHWQTLKAVCARDGYYVRTRDDEVFDLPGDVARPVLDGIAFAWSEFFSDNLKLVLERWTDRIQKCRDEFCATLLDAAQKRRQVARDGLKPLKAVFETNSNVLRELLSQMFRQVEARIERDQRTLYQSIGRQIQANMRPAFAEARMESGSGMKARMLATLTESVEETADVMFDDARNSLMEGVRSLNDWVRREATQMVQAVGRAAGVASENAGATSLQVGGVSQGAVSTLSRLLGLLEDFLSSDRFAA